jgi:alginate O-acetyltransferase complex protein AlgI
MLFNTWQFAAFFAVVFTLYHLLSRVGPRWQNHLLLLTGYVFYGTWDWRFCGLLLLSTVLDYGVGILMADAPKAKRKSLLVLAVVVNLALLGFFKYFNFFTDSLVALGQSLGITLHTPTLRVILPVGISFYTFQSMAYTIDVYRGRCPPVRNFLLYATYVSYFPQLVAGPIERAQHMIPQFSSARRVTGEQLGSGALLFLIGLVRKVAVADWVAPLVNRAFSDPAAHDSSQLLLGVLLFALQIYGDFAGYSDMARGTSRMLGIDLMENFAHPYFAVNITDFWRRWHISLSSWLKDYLYIALGGNRGPSWFVYRNLMLTMLIGGLWHGASWAFVVWGGIHGAALAVHKLWLRGRKVAERPSLDTPGQVASAVGAWLFTMTVVCVAWVFFRAPTFGSAFAILQGIVDWRGGFDLAWLGFFVQGAVILLAIDLPQYLRGEHTVALRWPVPVRALAYAAAIVLLFLHFSGDDIPFIYFQF